MICVRSATGSVRKTVSLLSLPLRTRAWATRSTPKPNAARAGSKSSSKPSTGLSSQPRTTMTFCGSCRKPVMKSRPANTSPSVLKVRSGLPGLKLSERTTPRNASRSGLPDGRPEEARDRPCRMASLLSEIFRSGSGSSTARVTSIKQSSLSSRKRHGHSTISRKTTCFNTPILRRRSRMFTAPMTVPARN